MTDKKLIQALREDAEWAEANEWETPITLSDNLTEAANRLGALLAENEWLKGRCKNIYCCFDCKPLYSCRRCGRCADFRNHRRSIRNSGKDRNVHTKWVSVDERLPERRDRCVLTVVNGFYDGTHFYDAIEIAKFVLDKGWILKSYPDWENPNVTYWRELPEPPSTEGVE